MRNLIKSTAVGQQSALSSAKRALLSKWLRGGPSQTARAAEAIIPRHAAVGPVPLSFEQQRLWFFSQMVPGSPLYTMPIGAKLSGDLRPHALQKGLDLVAARHEILRTRFVGEAPDQIVGPPAPVPVATADLRHLAPAEREAEAGALLDREAKRPFDLSRDPMIRALLVRLEEREWLFLVLMHHIASDDWSWRVLCSELAEIYEAEISGRPAQLPELPIRYSDFAAWQREWLRGDVLESHLSYWRRQLAGAPPVLELPGDHSRPAAQHFRGACEWLRLPRSLGQELDNLSQRAGVTPFMCLLGAFQTLLLRYTGQEDLLVGSPVAGRTRASLEVLIGLFINMVVLRTDLSGNPPFTELLRRVQRTVLEALAQQELPFEKLVQDLQPRRSPSHSPLIQVMFALQGELSESLRLPGLAVSPIQLDTGTSKFDLTLTIVKSGSSLNCCAEYNTDLFEPPTIRRLLSCYETLLQGIVSGPGRGLRDLPVLADGDRNEVSIESNRTEAEYPRDKCLHELLAAQAEESPEAPALVFQDRSLTYRELHRRANQLAHHLRRAGVAPGTLVALGTDRSAEMVIALLGILKAGGAYLPLDPAYPAERLRFMLDDSRAPILLTHTGDSPRWIGLCPADVRVIGLDSHWPEISREREDAPRAEPTPEDLAYVIYTSGSTGRPKGVQITHRSIINFLCSLRREPGLASEDTLLSVTSISFDIAAMEIFLPLCVGARLVVADADTALDGSRLAALIERSGATVMQATPTLWRLLADSGWDGNSRLRILCGGEKLSRELVETLLERGAEVWNLYGPTETTIWSTLCKVEKGGEPVPIGAPIANTQAYVLDSCRRPVPAGWPGELYIGGEGLARGYLNRPELTAEKFVPNPFSKTGRHSRLYRTGDIARRRPDGKLECLGRVDDQVKLRGHRIDPGEIESVLRRHPSIREALVSLREDQPGRARLVAYLVSSNGPPDPGELQEFLKSRLPDYMLPGAFVTLGEFPRTPNGKIDRRSLPKPALDLPVRRAVSAPPRTPLEEKLAGILREVLGLKQIGIDDNFFDIGGHSVLAMMVVSSIRKSFQADFTIRHLFDAPTIAGMAGILARQQPLALAGTESARRPEREASLAGREAAAARRELPVAVGATPAGSLVGR